MGAKTERSMVIFALCCFFGLNDVFAQNNSAPIYNPSAPVIQNTTTPSTNGNGTSGNGAAALAQAPASNGTSQVVNNPDGTQTVVQTILCPPPSALVKNGLFWGTPTGGWRSYSEAFDTSIVSFMGAQWVGINVGKMICIYKGNLAMSFPITLQNDTLAQTPTGNNWGTDQGGYRNCHSANMQDCPFVVKSQSVNMQQIYQSLDFFKGKPNPLTQPNS